MTSRGEDSIIPSTEHLHKGTLDCGLDYYVLGRGVEKPRHGVELRLLVKVGSLMESAEEQGLAHFVEHLGFKGTENFAKYELIRFLQSLGITYGADLNASTHLLETTFQLSTDICNEGDLIKFQHAVAVLKEWAFHMRIDEHDVAEEKAVIKAEYVSKQGLSERLLAKYWTSVFNDPADADCRLAKRMPIGIPDVFMKTDAKRIRAFYEKWYIPANMALVVVGDFQGIGGDVERVIEILRHVFEPVIPKFSTNVVADATCYLNLPRHHFSDTIILLADKEISVPQITCEFFIPCPSEASMNYLRKDILRRLICSVYDRRLHCISSGNCPFYSNSSGTNAKDNSPFLSAGISIRQVVRGLLCFGVSATVHSEEVETIIVERDNVKRALCALLTEMNRFAAHGVSEDEFISAKSKWEMLFCDQRDHVQSDAKKITADLVCHILSGENTIFEDQMVEAEMAIECLRSITLDEINSEILALDMHLTDSESSHYYCSAADSAFAGSFRVLSGQFPIKSKESKCAIDEKLLEQILSDVRSEIAVSRFSIVPWLSTTRIDPSMVIMLAQKAVGLRSTADERCPVDSGCICCIRAGPFLPTSLLCTPSSTTVSTFRVSEELGIREVMLNNGIKVALKWMPNSSPNRISMQAFALGGSTELSEAEEIVMSRLDSIAEQSYFEIESATKCTEEEDVLPENNSNLLRGVDISELQSRTKTYVSTQRHHNHRGIGGSCPSSNFELLLALLSLKLTSQKILPAAVQKNINLVRSQLANINNSPEAQFMEHARLLTCGDIPISRPISATALDLICINMASSLYERGFLRDPTEFTFVFVGALPSLSETTMLLEKYLSWLKPNTAYCTTPAWVSVTGSPSTLPFTPYPAVFPAEEIRDELSIRQAEKSSVLVVYRKDIPVLKGTLDNSNMELDALCKVVEIKLLDYLRIQLGKVYNVVVEHSKNSLSTFTLLTIGFHCKPGDCALIEEAIQAVIRHMQEVGPDIECLDGVKEAMIKKHIRDMDSSSHWLFWILDSYKDKAYSDSFLKEGEHEISVFSLIEARSCKKLRDLRYTLSCERLKELLLEIFGSVRVTVILSPEIGCQDNENPLPPQVFSTAFVAATKTGMSKKIISFNNSFR